MNYEKTLSQSLRRQGWAVWAAEGSFSAILGGLVTERSSMCRNMYFSRPKPVGNYTRSAREGEYKVF